MQKINYDKAVELSLELGVDGYVETMRVYNRAVDDFNKETDEKVTGDDLANKTLSDYSPLKPH